MTTVDIEEARTRFLELLELVAQGERFIVLKDGTPIAELVPTHKKHAPPLSREEKRRRVKQAQEYFSSLPMSGRSMVEELAEDREREAQLEAEEFERHRRDYPRRSDD